MIWLGKFVLFQEMIAGYPKIAGLLRIETPSGVEETFAEGGLHCKFKHKQNLIFEGVKELRVWLTKTNNSYKLGRPVPLDFAFD